MIPLLINPLPLFLSLTCPNPTCDNLLQFTNYSLCGGEAGCEWLDWGYTRRTQAPADGAAEVTPPRPSQILLLGGDRIQIQRLSCLNHPKIFSFKVTGYRICITDTDNTEITLPQIWKCMGQKILVTNFLCFPVYNHRFHPSVSNGNFVTWHADTQSRVGIDGWIVILIPTGPDDELGPKWPRRPHKNIETLADKKMISPVKHSLVSSCHQNPYNQNLLSLPYSHNNNV